MGKSLYAAFQTSENSEKGEGIVLNYGDYGKFRIHRAGGANRRFGTLFQAKMKPYTRQLQTDTMDEDLAREISIEVYAKTVVIGWEGVVGRDGDELPFSEENCVQLLTDLPDLFRDIQAAAQDRSLFLAEAQKAAEGN